MEDHEDVYDGYGYLAMAYPVTVQDEQCLNLAGIMNAKGGNVDKDFTLTAASVLLGRADLDLTALGFTYIPEEPETNQTVSLQ